MRNIFLILLLFINSNMYVFGQFNPISDLYYEQTYWFMNTDCPYYNCFELSWTQPDPSIDTLMGYKVFKDNSFWVFTEETDVTCSGYSPCSYPDFFDDLPFWITVKAVYNTDSALSLANDSVEVLDIAITVKEIKENEVTVLKNPISKGENISLTIPDNKNQKAVIKMYSTGGQLLKNIEIDNHNGGLIHFSSANLAPGIYIINIVSDHRVENRKILIE